MIDAAEQLALEGRARDAAESIRRLLTDPAALDVLLAMDPIALGARLRALALARGLGPAVKALRAALDERAARDEGEAATSSPSPGDLTTYLRTAGYPGAADLPPLPVPEGYDAGRAGVWRRGPEPVCVSRVLVAVVGRSVDTATGDTRLVLAWPYAGRWVTESTPRATALDGRALLASCAGRGCPVDGSTARLVAAWLAAQEQAAGAALPTSRAQSHLGWSASGDGFALSGRSLGEPVEAVPPGPGEAGASYGDQAGTLDGWTRTVWAPLSAHPGAVAVVAALAPPLLRVVGAVHGFALELAADSGQGKSTCLDAAASAWGPPARVVQRWPTTKAGARESLTYRQSVPTLWDEAQDVRTTPALMTDALYTVGGEHGKVLGHGGPAGGTREPRRVETVLISTGEAPAADRCGDAVGALARLVSLRGAPIARGQRELVTSLATASRTHYGHAGPALVAWLTANRAEWPRIRRSYEAHIARLQAEAADDQTARVSAHIALLHVTAEVMLEARIGSVPAKLLDHAVAAVTANAADRDVPLSALHNAHDWWIARKNQATGPVAHGIRIGWEDGNVAPSHRGARIAWLSGALHEALSSKGHHPPAIIRAWVERGWLITHEGRAQARVSSAVDESRPRAYIWSPAAMALLDHDDQQQF